MKSVLAGVWALNREETSPGHLLALLCCLLPGDHFLCVLMIDQLHFAP